MQDTTQPQPAPGGPTVDAHAIDYGLITLLCTHAMMTQIVYAMVRVTISYRTIELGLEPIWVGIITGASAVLPVLFAVMIGRFVDRGHDALTARLGSLVILGACLGYRLSSAQLPELLFFTAFLGVGHTLLMVSQQMLCVRSAGNAESRETAFGHYMVATALGQGLGPLIVGWLGGAQRIPPTRFIFGVAAVLAVAAILISLWFEAQERKAHAGQAETRRVPLPELLGTRGVPTLMIASVITVTAQDLIVIYLPILGAQRGIEVAHVGTLLMIRSATAVISRVFYPAMMRAVGRVPLTVGTMLAAALGLIVVASPAPMAVLYVAMCDRVRARDRGDFVDLEHGRHLPAGCARGGAVAADHGKSRRTGVAAGAGGCGGGGNGRGRHLRHHGAEPRSVRGIGAGGEGEIVRSRNAEVVSRDMPRLHVFTTSRLHVLRLQ